MIESEDDMATATLETKRPKPQAIQEPPRDPLAEIAAVAARRRATRERAYRLLVHDIFAGRPVDITGAADLLESLGFDAARLAEDVGTVRSFDRLQEKFAPGLVAARKRALLDIERQHEEALQKLAKAQHRIDAAETLLQSETLRDTSVRVRDAQRELHACELARQKFEARFITYPHLYQRGDQ